MIDRELVEEKLVLIRERTERLEAIRKMSEEAYLDTFDAQRIAERCLETSIHAAMDIGNHLIGGLGLEGARGDREVFGVLGRNRVLIPELAIDLHGLASLLPLLEHQFGDLDQRWLKRGVGKYLSTLSDFAAAAVDVLDHHDQERPLR